ncbi:MAG: phage major capsid protein [Ignavibacteria bacterium]|nr:phage major capsid protein [Ignavibacteria bacterium]
MSNPENKDNKELESISKEDVTKIVDEKLKSEIQAKKDLLEKAEQEKKALQDEIKRMKELDEVDRKNIKIGEPRNKKSEDFKEFLLKTVPDMRIKTGVSVPIPAQYFNEIVPSPGRTNILSQCKYQGIAQSTQMYITKTKTAPTGNWMGLTGGGTDTTLSAGAESVTMDCFTVKIPIYDYQMINPNFDPLQYMKDEVAIAIPKACAKQALAGTGSPFTGLYGSSDVTFNAISATGAITNVSLTDLRNMVATVYPDFRNNDLKWYVDMSEEQALYAVCDANNRVTDVTNGVSRILGYEVVPLPTGILNPATTSTTGSKHFVLANLKEAVEYADLGTYKIEAFRTTSGLTTWEIYYWMGLGVRNGYAAAGAKCHA